MRYILCLILLFGSNYFTYSQSRFTISGYVKEMGSSELLIGVNVYHPEIKTGTTTNNYGFYSITLPAADTVLLIYSYVGYKTEVRKIILDKNAELNIEMQSDAMLKEVEVVAGRYDKISEVPQMSVIEVPISQIKDIPALLGEKDVLKVLQLMPGVQSGSEGNSGLYVRGGGPDQNLIILDDAVVYNAYHLFGFFSLFNGDALKSVELTKGGFPARYGGRLSSVVEMNMKDGNKEELHGEGGIGLISSRLMVEGPLKKNKSSFLVSGRRTYIDILAQPFMPDNAKGGYFFYDLNAKVNYDFGRRDKIYLSGYFGRDRFYAKDKYDDDRSFKAGFDWGNATGTFRWNHLFNNRLFSNTSLIFSQYRFNINITEKHKKEETFTLDYFSGIRDLTFKYDIDYLPNPEHSIKAGIVSTFHRFSPSAVVLKDSEANEFKREVEHIDVVESGIYIEDIYRPIPQLRINGGLRLSYFKTESNSYVRPEPRLTASYQVKNDLALKASYARMNQYVHLLSNTGIGLPTDLWVPSTAKVAPQESQQVAIGIAKDIMNRDLTFTAEGYYKKSDNIIGYREGASFLLLDDPEAADKITWEENITSGKGWSYGMEFLLQRKIGKFSGWIGYTLSWTQLQFDSLNMGEKFYARYDRRHDISIVGIYHPKPKLTLSGTWVYGTGNAITLPQATFNSNEHAVTENWWYYSQVTDYGQKNGFRMAPYHRLDLGIQFHKKTRWGERTWEISVYNAYNRKNPFFYYLGNNYNSSYTETVLKQVTLFPIIPSVTYSFKF